MSKICQFFINSRLDCSNQLTTIIKMIKIFQNGKIDEIDKRVVIQKDEIQFIKEKNEESQEKRTK